MEAKEGIFGTFCLPLRWRNWKIHLYPKCTGRWCTCETQPPSTRGSSNQKHQVYFTLSTEHKFRHQRSSNLLVQCTVPTKSRAANLMITSTVYFSLLCPHPTNDRARSAGDLFIQAFRKMWNWRFQSFEIRPSSNFLSHLRSFSRLPR